MYKWTVPASSFSSWSFVDGGVFFSAGRSSPASSGRSSPSAPPRPPFKPSSLSQQHSVTSVYAVMRFLGWVMADWAGVLYLCGECCWFKAQAQQNDLSVALKTHLPVVARIVTPCFSDRSSCYINKMCWETDDSFWAVVQVISSTSLESIFVLCHCALHNTLSVKEVEAMVLP